MQQSTDNTITGTEIRQQRYTISYEIALITAVAAYTVIFSWLSILRYNSFVPSAYDMGIMIQTVWNTSHGSLFQESINMGVPTTRFWVAHWEFIYLIIAFFYKIFSSPYVLFVFQAAVVASGAIPVFYLAKQKINSSAAGIVLAFCYLLYPALQNAVLFDIHGVTLAAPFLLFAFYFLQKGDRKLFALFGFIALICREDSSLILFMMGLYAFVLMRDKKLGAATIAISLLYFFIWFKRMTIRAWLGLPDLVVMEGSASHWAHLSQVADNPLYLLDHLFKKYNVTYFFYLFAPLLFFSLLSPTTLLLAAPVFAINLLSDYYFTHAIEHHYSATIAPFVFIAAIYGIKNFYRIANHLFSVKLNQTKLSSFVYPAILLASIIIFVTKSNAFNAGQWQITEHHKHIKKIAATIPENASLSALNKLVPHVAERHEIYVFDDQINHVDYILYDFYAPDVRLVDHSTFVPASAWAYNERIADVLQNKNYGIVQYTDGVCLWKKGSDYKEGLRILAVAQPEEILNPATTELDQIINLAGYNIHPVRKQWFAGENGLQYKHQLHFTCFWMAANSSKETNLEFKIKNGDREFNFIHQPVFQLYPTSLWQANEIIRDEIFWKIPEDAVSDIFEVFVAVTGNDKKEYKFLFEIETDEVVHNQ